MVEARLRLVLFGNRKKGQKVVENDKTFSKKTKTFSLKDPWFVPHVFG